MKAAVDLLMDPNNHYEKLVIVRPAVEAEEKLGSLPGNLEEKLDPYIFPSYYLLNKIIGKESREKLKDAEIIEVFALAYMRGMNIDNTILIFEEAQNSSPNQMKLLLTRIGFNSKFFISGDIEQTDRYKDKKQSGLYDAIHKFKGVPDVGVFEFGDEDVVRNPLITKILKKYDENRIEINGVLRDTIGKFTQLYEKHMIEEKDDDSKTFEIDMSGNTEELVSSEEFEYKILSEVTSLNLMDHFKFNDEDELYKFTYEDFGMQIFGHAGSTETFTFNDLNEIYLKYRDNNELLIVSDEMGKSKPASLFFLSKFGCQLEKVKFYSNSTINSMWNEIDILLTANPNLLLEKPKDKIVVKYNTIYNKNVDCEYEINSLKEFDEILQKIKVC